MSALCTDKTTDLDELVGSYNVTLSLLINRHAPLQTKRVTNCGGYKEIITHI